MRLLTKAEACREMRLSLSTLNWRIAAGEVAVKRKPRGRRYRVYVMLDDDSPENAANTRSQGTLLDVDQERIRGLDEQVGCSLKPSLHWSRNGTPDWRRSIGRGVSSATG